MPGDETDLYAKAHRALLDALEALGPHAGDVVVIGAQAIYLHTGAADLAVAPFTVDADLAIDPRDLQPQPLIEEAMSSAGFALDVRKNQPGAWISPDGVAVDLMVPATVSGVGGRRGARIPPHSNKSARRAAGLEAAIVDHGLMEIAGAVSDGRQVSANVAGPAALMVSKLHKLAEREGQRDRLFPKDAHDVYRLLVATDPSSLAATLRELLVSPLAATVTADAVRFLETLFAAGPGALGSRMAGQAEADVGDPAATAQAAAFLASDVLQEVR